MILAGVLLGLATLDKYYPALLIPFFALDARVWQPRLILSALVTIAHRPGRGHCDLGHASGSRPSTSV